jgi:hypothetical protein
MNKHKIIEWFDEDGNLYGNRGLSLDLETNIITKFNGVEEPLSIENLPDVLYCIEQNKIYLNESIQEIEKKLAQTETKRIPIENGYKISEPLSDKFRSIYLEDLKTTKDELEFITNLKVEVKVKYNYEQPR